MMRGVVPRVLFVLVAFATVVYGVVVVWPSSRAGFWMMALVAAIVVWAATRPLHPPVPVLYRWRLRSAWETWVEALEAAYARDPPDLAAGRRSTEHLLLRLEALRPPRSWAAEHDERRREVEAYAETLRAR